MDARRPEWTIVLRLDFLPDSGPELHLSDSRTLDMVRSFTQSEQAADPVALAEPGCIAAGQRLAGPLIEL
jgi:hypothetical protein